MWHDGVYLVICTGGFSREFEDTYVGGFYVEGYGAYFVVNVEYDIAGVAFRFGHVGAYQSWEVSVYHFYQVAFFKVNIVE